MSLTAGSRLGPYQILAPIGAGGMGEVFRARDTRLLRDVAVKVLPASLASDPERRARFEQEARAASALNHPNIITLFDIGDADGLMYIAMEYVEGKTLRELLGPGTLPSRKVLEIAEQLADGLAKAHEAGILHRDLKPDNVMVSKDGFVKILDFGLAKLAAATSLDGVSELETAARPATSPGAVMGTVGYMSPEQASGRPVDFRSDQFSLGAVLYEMVTGSRPFARGTNAETLVAIIREEPEDPGKLNPRSPAPLRWLIERCLEKDPEDRFSSTRDLARDLGSLREHLSESSVSGEGQAPGLARQRWVRPLAWAALGLVAGLGLAALGLRRPEPAAAPTFTRLTFRRGTVLSARFAPDGQTVVYSAAWEGRPPEIFTVRLDGPESRSLGLPPAEVLSVSPTGELAICLGRRVQWGFEGYGTLARVPLGGGSPRDVAENVGDADWALDGSLAVSRDTGLLRRLEFPIGTVRYETAGWISHVRVAADGRRVLFLDHAQRGDNVGRPTLIDETGVRKVLAPFAISVAWAANGEGVWLEGGQFVDAAGKTRQVLAAPGITTLYDVSKQGRQLLGRANWRREIVGLAPGEKEERNLTWLDWSHPDDLSPNGKTLLFDEQNQVDRDGNYTVYLRGTDGSPPVRLGIGASSGLSPDGKWALATLGSEGDFVLLPTGAGEPRRLDRAGLRSQWAAWFPDGERLLVSGSEAGRGNRLYVRDLGSGSPRAVSPEGVSFFWRAVSPDGTRAVAASADGTPKLYPVEGGEPQAIPAVTSQDVPIRWSADGRSIYVQRGVTAPSRVEIVDVATGARRPWKVLTPPDPTGVASLGPIVMTTDGSAYAYSYRRLIEDLFVAEGLR